MLLVIVVMLLCIVICYLKHRKYQKSDEGETYTTATVYSNTTYDDVVNTRNTINLNKTSDFIINNPFQHLERTSTFTEGKFN